jgi:hypothetical protein
VTRPRAVTLTTSQVAGSAITSTCLLGAALAAPSHWKAVHNEFSSISRNSCDVRSLTTRIHIIFDARFRFVARGYDRLPHVQDFGRQLVG